MILVKPNIKYIKTFRKYINQYKIRNDIFYINLYEEAFGSFSKYIELLNNNEKGKSLPVGWSSYSTFWLEDNNEIVGVIRIRHKNSKHFGHIGYDIAPEYRNLGYGSKILELGIIEARKLGFDTVVLTCLDYNIASQKVIKKNGGFITNIFENKDGETLYSFEINLSKTR